MQEDKVVVISNLVRDLRHQRAMAVQNDIQVPFSVEQFLVINFVQFSVPVHSPRGHRRSTRRGTTDSGGPGQRSGRLHQRIRATGSTEEARTQAPAGQETKRLTRGTRPLMPCGLLKEAL